MTCTVTGLVRDATFEDLPRIVEIYNLAVPTKRSVGELKPVSVESRIDWFRSHDAARRPIWVLEEQEVVGWISLQSFGSLESFAGTAEVSLFIAPEHQRRGKGRFLLTKMIEACPQLGIESLIGTCFGHNIATIRLNRGLGFRRWGRFPGVADLEGRSADLVFMGLKIGDVVASDPDRSSAPTAPRQARC